MYMYLLPRVRYPLHVDQLRHLLLQEGRETDFTSLHHEQQVGLAPAQAEIHLAVDEPNDVAIEALQQRDLVHVLARCVHVQLVE